jgi:hypothetical protein
MSGGHAPCLARLYGEAINLRSRKVSIGVQI